jgi:hypothetical protein
MHAARAGALRTDKDPSGLQKAFLAPAETEQLLLDITEQLSSVSLIFSSSTFRFSMPQPVQLAIPATIFSATIMIGA